MKIALVIRHVAFEDLGLFERVIEAAGYQVRYLEAGMDDLSWVDPMDPALMIVLGGPIGANDEAEYPFIHDELNILQARLNNDLPTLGICLGAQLMARALGARVFPAGQEVGWLPLELSDAGYESPLAHLSGENTQVLHWHADTFDLPEGAVGLASTDKTRNQAFQWKKRGLALQFHPEVTVHGLERWYIGHTSDIHQMQDMSVSRLREQAEHYGYEMDMFSTRFMEEWLASIA